MEIERITHDGDIKIIMSKEEARKMQTWLYSVTSYTKEERFEEAHWIGNRIGLELEK